MDDYLSKPTILDTLNQMIRKWLPAAIAARRSQKAETSKTPALSAAKAPEIQPSSTPLDLTALKGVIGDDDAFMLEVLILYRSTEQDTAKNLDAHIRARDSIALIEAAHAAKGAARSAYATDLARLYGQLEAAAKSKDWNAIPSLTTKVKKEFQRVMEFVDTLISGLQR